MTIDEAMTIDMVTGHQQVVGSVEQQIAFDGKRVQDTNTQNLIHDDTHKLGKMASHSFECTLPIILKEHNFVGIGEDFYYFSTWGIVSLPSAQALWLLEIYLIYLILTVHDGGVNSIQGPMI